MVTSCILIVDDEPALLGLLRRFLERAGYEVDSAGNAAEALRTFQAQSQKYSLLISDMTMPEMGGEDLVRKVHEIRPELPAILMSGYPYIPQMPNVGFLQKPFLPNMLTEAVKAALAA